VRHEPHGGDDMARLIKRYRGGSRKLYDFQESRYVSLEELAAWIRGGEWVEVRDSETGRDVTAQTLAQVIYEREKRGGALPSGLLHDLIRRGGEAISAVLGGLRPVLDAREEMVVLRRGLSRLERALAQLERRRSRHSAHS